MKIWKETMNFISTRKRAYRACFDKDEDGNFKPTADRVLVDLAKFCRAHETTATTDERTSAIMEGRREVWLRIQHHLQMTDDQLWDLYTNKAPKNN